jgi:uncharacterized membrane protein
MKKYLLAGVLVWLPIAVTFWFIHWIIESLDQILLWLPPKLQPEYMIGIKIPGLGVVLTLLGMVLTGILAANVLGQKILEIWDRLLSRIPVVKSIYSGVKQVGDTLLSESGQAFRQAVLVRYPHQNTWTIAFLTGKTPEAIIPLAHEKQLAEDEWLSLYVPTTPNPTSGYLIMARKSDTIPLDMSVDEALKYVISMGVVYTESKNL